ncbi:MAG: hypothetical protein KF910_10440 [Brevundimonas sp.]|uniref:hypothetical protein n=1 Tax=Brevundimonas sp. TaxID=1871086 RepID=UPI0025C0592A|nr:hypothetical protein [Brevundimonas sp.]MBX3478018.1 hypothetical protein [Brevundimonas sp.]
MASHKWFSIALFENTRGFRLPARLAFLVMRVSLVMIPFVVMASIVTAANPPADARPSAQAEAPPEIAR